MKPIKIEHENAKLYKGFDSKKIGKVEDLWVLPGDDGAKWSAWVPTFREKVKILFGFPIWVGIYSESQPPVGFLIEKKIWNWK